jgi:hypothetical protein
MNTNEKGDIGLANIIMDVINKGYFVFLPFSDSTEVDLIVADKCMKLKRLQIKYRAINKLGCIEVVTSTCINGKSVPVDLSKTDIWAIYCPDNKEIYYINTLELLGKKVMKLRISKPKLNNLSVRYAHQYLDLNNVWNET